MLLLHIAQTTRIRNNSKTLLDNICSNVITPNNISGNITTTISDHLPQFLIALAIFFNPPSAKLNIFESYWSKFDHKNFFSELSICRLGEFQIMEMGINPFSVF